MDSGWIKLHRKMTDWEWYTDVPTKTLFIHLLLTANHKPGKWQGIDVPVGATITSIRKLATETGLSIQQVRTAIKHLISTHDLTQSSTAKYTVFKLENYDSYQESNTESNTPPTHCQHTANTLLTTNKNNKNNKNERMKDKQASEMPSRLYGVFRNIRLTEQEYDDFLKKHPLVGMDVINQVSQRLNDNPNKVIHNMPNYLEGTASKVEEEKQQPKAAAYDEELLKRMQFGAE